MLLTGAAWMRHSGGFNGVFLDGHCEKFKRDLWGNYTSAAAEDAYYFWAGKKGSLFTGSL